MPAILFNCVLEKAFRELNWDKLGINISGKKLNADDILLFSYDEDGIKRMINDLMRVCKKYGLTINWSKTKVMSNINQNPIAVEEGIKENVKEHVYLGQM